MQKPFSSSVLLFVLCLGLTSLGFSSWIFSQDSNINIDAVVNVGNIKERNALTKVSDAETFSITKSGLLQDEIFISTCGIKFSYEIDNSYFQPEINSITYKILLVLDNIQSDISSFFTNCVINETTYSKTSGTLLFIDNQMKFNLPSIDIPLNKASSNGKTALTITFNFTDPDGSLFNLISNNVNANIFINQVGVN